VRGASRLLHIVGVALSHPIVAVNLDAIEHPLSLHLRLLVTLRRVLLRDGAQLSELAGGQRVLTLALLLAVPQLLLHAFLDARFERRLAALEQRHIGSGWQRQRRLVTLPFVDEADRTQEADPALRASDLLRERGALPA